MIVMARRQITPPVKNSLAMLSLAIIGYTGGVHYGRIYGQHMATTLQSAQKALGKRIRQLREKKGWSQAAFADKCGVTIRYIVKIEQGESNLPFTTIIAIAKALGVTAFALLDGIV
jgi:DNA-binding XRE family transcriptional regulator